jgi:hypothetical protein
VDNLHLFRLPFEADSLKASSAKLESAIMPMLSVGKTKSARMWVYVGDEAHAYNIFHFTLNRGRDGPKYFLRDCQVLLADGYGGYDGVVAGNEITRAAGPMHVGSSSMPRKWRPRLQGRPWI